MKFIRFIGIVLWFVLTEPAGASGHRTDVIILTNGDRITGEIKSLEAGLLEYKTDTMATVYIEWRFISEIISDTSQVVETNEGARILGTLQKPAHGDHVIVGTVDGPVDVEPEDVTSVWPVKATFVDRMELSTSFGLDYKKATDIANLNAAVDFRVRGDERLTEASLRTDITRQGKSGGSGDEEGGDDQTRWTFDAFHEYLLVNNRFRNWFGKFESNEATGVDLRSAAGGGFGKYLKKTNHVWFSISGGLQFIRENPKSENAVSDIEVIAGLRYRYFRYAVPKRSLDTTLNIYPSLTDRGRIRSDLRTTFNLELIEDLFWSMELYATHDNQPLSEDVPKTDYGIITSVGWKY